MNALIIDHIHEVFPQSLREAGWDVRYEPDMDVEAVTASLTGVQLLVLRSKIKVDENLLTHADALKMIARAGSGMDLIDSEACARRGIQCVNAGEGNRNAVAEHTLGMILNLLHRIVAADTDVRNYRWRRSVHIGEELGDKTVGIIGFGNVGSCLAKKLKGLCAEVLAYDKYRNNLDPNLCREATLEEIHKNADIVSLHIPLTVETRGMINSAWISKFAKPIWLVNTSRGEILQTKDLVLALEQGVIHGAALDVLEEEKEIVKNKDSLEWFGKLIRFDRVLLTPHVAGWSSQSYYKIANVLKNKVLESF